MMNYDYEYRDAFFYKPGTCTRKFAFCLDAYVLRVAISVGKPPSRADFKVRCHRIKPWGILVTWYGCLFRFAAW